MKNERLFQKYMTGMGEVFNKEISDILKDVYWRALEPFSDERCKKAFDEILVTQKWFPKPAELLEIINKTKPKQIEDQSEIQVTYIISQIGQRSVRFDDPITKHLMTERWKWSNWAPNIIETELKWWAKEFKDAYRAFSGSETPLHIEAPEQVRELIKGIGKRPSNGR